MLTGGAVVTTGAKVGVAVNAATKIAVAVGLAESDGATTVETPAADADTAACVEEPVALGAVEDCLATEREGGRGSTAVTAPATKKEAATRMRLVANPFVLPMSGKRDQRTAARTRGPSLGIHATTARAHSSTMTSPPIPANNYLRRVGASCAPLDGTRPPRVLERGTFPS